MSFVRKNALIFTALFVPADGTVTQPTEANAVLKFKNTSGALTQVVIALTYNPTNNNWVGVWDSSSARQGNVDWMIYGDGSLVAAAQGSFQIDANSANNL